jgi:hypothetical protein
VKQRYKRKKVSRLSLKGKLSKEKANKFNSYLLVGLAIIVRLYFLLLGIGGLWVSPWSWVSGIIST